MFALVGHISRRAILAAVMYAFCTTAMASAAEPDEFPVGGAPTQRVEAVVPGPSGSVWFVQLWSGSGSANPGDQLRVGRITANGSVTDVAVLPGTPGFSDLASTSDGTALLATSIGEAWILKPGSVPAQVSFPSGFRLGTASARLAAGQDGRFWLLGCTSWPACSDQLVAAVTDPLQVALFDVPELDVTRGALPHPVATDEGVWFSGGHSEAWQTPADFVSYTGTATSVLLPTDAWIIGSGGGGTVLWTQEFATSFMAGFAAPDGRIYGQRGLPVLPASIGTTHVLGFRGNRPGRLLWTENVGSDKFDGRLGTLTLDDSAVFDVPWARTSIPRDSPSSFTGSCMFGLGLLETGDGAQWISSSGHPWRMSRRGPDGDFRTFTFPSLSQSDGGLGYGIIASDGTLWYPVAGGDITPRVGRIDPSAPPAGLPSLSDQAGVNAGTTPEADDPRPRVRRRATHTRLQSRTVTLRGRTAKVRLACSGSEGSGCRGNMRLTGRSRRLRGGGLGRRVTVAGGRFALASGTKAAVSIKLSHTGRRIQRSNRAVRHAHLKIVATDAARHVRRVRIVTRKSH